ERRYVPSHAGLLSTWGANLTAVFRSTFSGIGGDPQSRAVANTQSSVTMSAFAPALLARSMRASMSSLLPCQYTWNSVLSLTAMTSSIGFEPNEDSPIAVPDWAAPLATATSPSGCTACTPVGETITGSE